MVRISLGRVLGLVVVGLLTIAATAHAVTYNVTPLGTLGGWESSAHGINATGQVVGEACTSTSSPVHPFLYDGNLHDLGSLGGTYNVAHGINANGQVVGEADTTGNAAEHAFLYDGTMHDLGTLGGSSSRAFGINDRGQVVGFADTTGNAVERAFLYDGTMHELGTFGGNNSRAYGINDNGQVVGYARTSNSSNHAFLYDGTMHDLGTLGGTRIGIQSVAYSINNSQWVVGGSYTKAYDYLSEHAFLYDGTMHDLGTLGGTWSHGKVTVSCATSINASGQVVGFASTGGEGFPMRAFFYDSVMHDLNDLLVAGSGWTITDADAINDNGWIAATGYNASVNDGFETALLLTPINVPEPASLGILGLGVMGLVLRRRRSA